MPGLTPTPINADAHAMSLATPRWFVRWLATVGTLLLAIAWITTNFCTVHWQSVTGRWGELADGRILSGKNAKAPEDTDIYVNARQQEATMHWGFDFGKTPDSWAVPIWAPMGLGVL